ncbi:PREDICTED: uncharacterized protein LOC101294612 [Fragaria vesca subsp. vesca]
MAGPDGHVRKLALFFEKLGASSPPDTRKSSEIRSNPEGPVAGGGASVDKRQFVPCDVCSKLNPPNLSCSYSVGPCDICDKVQRINCCPYLNHLPQGATFNSGYGIVCVCGYVFDEVKWVVPYVVGAEQCLRPRIVPFVTSGSSTVHMNAQKDKDLAAEYKSIREKMLSEVSTPIAWSGTYVPTDPCGDMKEKDNQTRRGKFLIAAVFQYK